MKKNPTYSSRRKCFGPPLKKCFFVFPPLNFVLVLIFSLNLLLLPKNEIESLSVNNWNFKKYAQIVNTFCQFVLRQTKIFFKGGLA